MIDKILEIIVSRLVEKLQVVVREEVEYVTTTVEEAVRAIVDETLEAVRVTLFYLFSGIAAVIIGGFFFVFGLAKITDYYTGISGIGYLLIGALVLIVGASALSKSRGEE